MISFLARPMARFAVLGAIILSRVLGLTPGVGRTTTQGQCECHLPTSASAHLWKCRTTQAQIDPRKYPVCEDNARGLPWPPECRHNRGCHLRSLEAAHPLGVQAQTLLQAQGAGLPVGLRAVHGARETCPSAHGGVQAADLWAARHCLGLPPLQRLLQPSPQGLSPLQRLLQPSPQGLSPQPRLLQPSSGAVAATAAAAAVASGAVAATAAAAAVASGARWP